MKFISGFDITSLKIFVISLASVWCCLCIRLIFLPGCGKDKEPPPSTEPLSYLIQQFDSAVIAITPVSQKSLATAPTRRMSVTPESEFVVAPAG